MEPTILRKTDSHEISYFTLHIVFVFLLITGSQHRVEPLIVDFLHQNLRARIIKQISWEGTGPNGRGRAGGNGA